MSKPAPLPLEEAQKRLLALAAPLPVETLSIEDAVGRFLAAPLKAQRTQPATDLSAMDGYAVGIDDMAGPWTVIGESAAGHPYDGLVPPGTAIRIATGAAMPAETAAVILQEDISRDGDRITLSGNPPEPPRKHVRKRGLDFEEGESVLDAGTRIGPAQAALAISSGHSSVPVHGKPRIAIIDSGDELSVDPASCADHQIPASNGQMLAAMAETLPCTVDRLGPVADDLKALADVLERASDADLIVTSGGASVGDHDLIRPALETWGASIDFWRVAIKPGKPILIATRQGARGKQVILGLPGNPVSSHVTAYLFMLPLIRALQGALNPLPRHLMVRLAGPLAANGTRRTFVRAHWDGLGARAQTIQDSGALASLAASNILIDREAGAASAASGEEVLAYLLENGGIA